MDSIKGYVEHIVYRNEDNGYTVFNLNNDDGEMTCVGNFHYIEEGELLKLQGEYTTHKLYGLQFKAEAAEVCEPEDLVSIERYLGSGAVKGIGAALAGRIVKKFKQDTFRIIHSSRRKEGHAPGNDLFAEIRNIDDSGSKDIPALRAERVPCHRTESLPDSRPCAWRGV